VKLTDYIKLSEEQEVTLIGKKINRKTLFIAEMSGKPWNGSFDCSCNKLTSLVGAPSSVGGNFSCSRNKLTSLEGAPSSVGGGFLCSDNKLTSLVGAPSSVGGYFSCSSNNLTSLVGAPSSVGGGFLCSYNELTSLHDVHKIIKKMNRIIWAENNPITSCVLGVLLIEGCTKLEIDNKKVQHIVNKYLPNHRGFSAVIECQSELLDAGFDEYAKL